MADSFNWQVIIDLAMNGGPQTKRELETLQKAERELQKTTEQATRSTDQQGAALKKNAQTAKQSADSINTLRYANYDLAQTMLTVSAAVTATGAATVVAFAKQERAFTDVERTAEGSLGTIRDTINDLSTTLPLAFTDLAGIATLGNQLGVEANNLEKFTETVAAFSTATGITAEASAQAFGRIGNILRVGAEDYDRLASAIVYTGRTSAATEKEIISLTERLGASADRAGFAESEVIGLAGALGSVAVAPERAQGVFETYFNTLNESLAEGGRRAQLFAQVVGVSVEELNNMVRSGQGLDVFRRFATTLGDPANDTVELTNALSELGLSGLRANEVIGRISQRMDLFDRSMQNANKAFMENTELQSQMALILDDLDTKWKTTVNAVVNLAAAFGSTLAPVLGPVLDSIKSLAVAVTEFINTPFGSAIAQISAIIAGAVAVFTLYRGAVALATASTYALITAQRGLAASGATSAMGALASALGLVGGASGTAAGGLTVVRTALTRLLAATGVGAVVVLLGSAFVDLRGTLQGLIGVMQGSYNTFSKYLNGFRNGVGLIAGVTNIFIDVTRVFEVGNRIIATSGQVTANAFDQISGRIKVAAFVVENAVRLMVQRLGLLGRVAQFVLAPVTAALNRFGAGFNQGAGFVDNIVNKSFDELNNLAGLLPSTLDEGSSAMDDFLDSAGGLGGATGDLGGLNSELDKSAASVRTLSDYANDLASVWDRAFDIRFGSQQTLDAITTSFQDMRDAAAEARQNVRSLNADIQGLNSDLNIQKYFLGIAESYGDEKRAAAIRAQIAKTEADLADKVADRNKAQQEANKSLTGNSAAAIKNRSEILGLVQQYQAHVQALAASGLSTEELKRATDQLEQDFISQATQLGFNRDELGLYTQSFRDVTTVIDNVPRDITVNFNADPALQALNEFAAQAASSATTAGTNYANNFSNAITSIVPATFDQLLGQVANDIGRVFNAMTLPFNGGIVTGALVGSKFGGRGYAAGGYTGPGGKYDEAGIVHRGEYVIPKHLVNQRTGLPYADAMGRLQRGAPSRRGYSGGGFVGGGSGSGHIASFGPMAAMQLAQALTTQVSLSAGQVATAVNQANQNASALGAS